MAAIGVNEDGYREVIGCAESSECWRDFLSWLKSRGLRGVRMLVGDKAAGMVGSIAEVFPDARYQCCTVHFYRNILASSFSLVGTMLIIAAFVLCFAEPSADIIFPFTILVLAGALITIVAEKKWVSLFCRADGLESGASEEQHSCER